MFLENVSGLAERILPLRPVAAGLRPDHLLQRLQLVPIEMASSSAAAT
jgi:hypothetical protein